MNKTGFRKLLAILCVLLCVMLLACACAGNDPDADNGGNPDGGNTPGGDQPGNENNVTYTVTVTDENGAPVAGATVDIYAAIAKKGTATTNESGVATLTVAKGVYTEIKVNKVGYEVGKIDLTGNTTSVSVQLVTDNTVTYKVTVREWPTDPVVGATVQLCVGDICRLPVVTDANGVATLQLERDNYTVKVHADGYEIEPYYNFEEGQNELVITLYRTKGSVYNPFFFSVATGNEITVPAGETVYFQFRPNGGTLELLGDNASLLYNGDTYTSEGGSIVIEDCGEENSYSPDVFAVTNTGSTETVYTVNFLYPEGYEQNPKAITMGANTATTRGSYFFSYVATEAGSLTITIDDSCTNWRYIMTNMTTSIGGVINSSTDSDSSATCTLEVAAGDVIRVAVSSADDTSTTTVTFTAAFTPAN